MTTQLQRYAAGRTRPAAYPASLPFVPDRDVEVSAGDPPRHPLVARWHVTDPDALFGALVSASIESGWRVRPRTPSRKALATTDCVLERCGIIRGITITRIDTLAIVCVVDARVPESWRDQPREGPLATTDVRR